MSLEKEPAPYIRRRAYSKIHVTSWVIYLEKDGFVRCSFKNCNFMAFDVEEMCNHYGFCTGVNSTAKFVCEYCKGCTNEKKKLDLHLVRAHNVKTPVAETESDPMPSESVEKSKPSRVLKQSWDYFYEQYNYIKCLTCDYLANSRSDMCRHYESCNSEREKLLYVCSECKGRTIYVNPLLLHLLRSHKIFKTPNQFNHISKSMVRYWEREIEDKGYACCLHANKGELDCFYFDQKLLGIVEHSQCCKGPNFATVKVQCPLCSMWTSTAEMLQCHIDSDYHRNEGTKSSQSVISTHKPIKEEQKDESSGHCTIVTTLPKKKHEGLSTSFTVIESDKNPDEDIEISIIDEVTRKKDSPSGIYVIKKEDLNNADAREEENEELKINTVYTLKNQNKPNKNIDITQSQDVKTKITQCGNVGLEQNKPSSSNNNYVCVKQQKDHLIIKDIQNDTAKNSSGNHSLGCTSKKEIVENNNDTSKLSLKSMQKTSIHHVKEIIEQKELILNNEQYKSKVKDLEGDVVEEQNIVVDQNKHKYYAPKDGKIEGCDIAIDYEESSVKPKNDFLIENIICNLPKQSYVINNARFVKTYNKKSVKSSAPLKEKFPLSTTSQGNSISINILKDWNESDEVDSSDESVQAENPDLVKKSSEKMSMQEIGNNARLVKCSNEGEDKFKYSQEDKMRKAHTKQPRLFEDVLLSDDDDDYHFSREENFEPEVNKNLLDHKKEHHCDKVITKNYLKRRGSSDSVRPSCSKRTNTSLVESNIGSEHKIVEGVMKTFGHIQLRAVAENEDQCH